MVALNVELKAYGKTKEKRKAKVVMGTSDKYGNDQETANREKHSW